MKTLDAIKHAGGTSALASMLGITPGAISQWGDTVPDARQLLIEKLTGGELVADESCIDRITGMSKLRPDIPWGVLRNNKQDAA